MVIFFLKVVKHKHGNWTQTRPKFSGEKPFLLGAGAGKTQILNTGAGAGTGCAYTRSAPYYLNCLITLIFNYISSSLSFLI
jgi:hypothetical protein